MRNTTRVEGSLAVSSTSAMLGVFFQRPRSYLAPLHPGKILITKVTFTLHQLFSSIHLVVWQFWGRAAEASWTAKSEALFLRLYSDFRPYWKCGGLRYRTMFSSST
jgi:hypothetical protein